MTNTILTYDTIETANYIAQDYTSKKFVTTRAMNDLFDSDYIEHIELIDNQTMEQISYSLYDTADYWDILVIINNRDPLFDMSYDYDILSNIATNVIEEYAAGYSGIYKQASIDLLEEAYLANLQEENEEIRTLKIVKPAKMVDFIKKYRELRLEESKV